MSEHAFYKVLSATPVNASARRAVRQGNCSYEDQQLSRAEIIDIINRLERKQRLLKAVLGITKKCQYVNMANKLKGRPYGSGLHRIKGNPRAAIECVRCGTELQRLNRALQIMKAESRGVAPVMHGWTAA